jgi:hypothetical protein
MRWQRSSAARAMAALLLVSLAMAGCARPTDSSGEQGDQTTPTATSKNTPSPEAAVGGVKITLTKEHFGLQEQVSATVQNELATSIWTTDHHADCGLLTLEYLSGGVWRAVAQCSQPRPVKVVEIQAGASVPQSIGISQNMDMAASWSAGTYRLSLTYALNQNQAALAGASTTRSTTFTIG